MMGTTTRRDATRCCKFTMGRVKPGVLDALGVQVSANGIVAGLAGPVWEARLCLETHKDSDRLLHGSHGREAPRPRKRAYFQVPHLVLGRPSRGEKTDGRERHGPRSTSPVSPRPARICDTHPQPQTDRNRHRLRESDVTLPGWGANLGWRQESRDTVHSGRQPPGRVSAVTSDHIVMM